MSNDLLLSLAVSLIPALAIGFVGILLLYKIYVHIRCKYNATVNCWFCNQNSKVPYLATNSWTCPFCEQYNGFTKDGDYNREIFEQLACSNIEPSTCKANNGFCDVCNEAQRLKIEKLAQFEPKNESHFDAELKIYQAQLEEQYRLCATCDRHLNRTLREKKKMVLGSKLLDYLMKGAASHKQPHLTQARRAKQQQWKRRLGRLITILTALNLYCLYTTLPSLKRNHLTDIFGESFGHTLFLTLSHVVALSRVLGSYLDEVHKNVTVVKIGMFVRMLFMLVLYSFGLKLPQITALSFVSLYVLACPFVTLGAAFTYNIVDNFRLTRFTFLLVLWSAFAGGLINDTYFVSQNVLMLFASLITFAMSFTAKVVVSPRLHDVTANSFHRIYSEDYLSDEDSVSRLSQSPNSSSASSVLNRSFRTSSPQTRAPSFSSRAPLVKSPISASAYSLNGLTRSHFTPNSSFGSHHSNQLMHSPYAGSLNITHAGHTPFHPSGSLFGSNSQLNCHLRPASSLFGLSTNNGLSKGAYERNDSLLTPRLEHAFYARDNGPNSALFRSGTPAATVCGSCTGSGIASSAAAMHAPFSAFGSTAQQQQNSYAQRAPSTSSLLMPSRFAASCVAPSVASAPSWVSGGYFNQQHQAYQTQTHWGQQFAAADVHALNSSFRSEHRDTLSNTPLEDNASRASSHSSGFESQIGRTNMSRENSYGHEAPDVLQRTASLDGVNGFQPIHANGGEETLTHRAPLLAPKSNYLQPLTVNCSPAASEKWTTATTRPTRNGRLIMRDSFNLRKINEELPNIKRGDLLKKWKEGQGIS